MLTDFKVATFLADFISKNTSNFTYTDIYSNTQAQLKFDSEFSIEDGTFYFSSWHSNYPIHRLPNILDFQFLSKNQSDLQILINFYQNSNPNMTKFPTFQSSALASQIIHFLSDIYFQLPIDKRITAWSILGGFFTPCILPTKSLSFNSEACKDYVYAELSNLNFIKIDHNLHQHFYAGKIFSIKEQKLNQTTGEFYEKLRHVVDGTIYNEHILDPGKDFHYTFPTVHSLFKSTHHFSRLMNSNYASVFDKTCFYRDILTIPNNYSYVNLNGQLFVDIKAQMGHKNSASYAQLTSNLLDYTYNHNYKDESVVTLQDDSLFLQTYGTLTSEKIENFNAIFGYKINHKKTQLNFKKVEWSGFNLDIENKFLSYPVKKLRKLHTLIDECKDSTVSRRQIAKILGKIYSASIITNSFGLNLSSITMKTRKYMFYKCSKLYDDLRNKWFFDSFILKDRYKQFFDEILPKPNAEVIKELHFILELISLDASFSQIRKTIFNQNSANYCTKFLHQDYQKCFTDASSKGYGIYIQYTHKGSSQNFAFHGKFEYPDSLASINIKEFFALTAGVLICILLDFQFKSNSKFLVFIDNTAAESLATSKKAKIKNPILADLTHTLSFLQFSVRSSFSFHRIKSKDNVHSDLLSRSDELPSCGLGLSFLDISNLSKNIL